MSLPKMARLHSKAGKEQDGEGKHHEVLEGIRLVGQEAPSFPMDPFLQAALGEEMRQIQARALGGDQVARRYVGSWRKVLG